MIAAICRHYPLTPAQVRDMPMGDIGLLLEQLEKAAG